MMKKIYLLLIIFSKPLGAMHTNEIYLNSSYNPNGMSTIPYLAQHMSPYANGPDEVIPVYHNTRTIHSTPKQTIQKQEQTSLLKTTNSLNLLKPDTEIIMKKLHAKVDDFIFGTCERNRLQELHNMLFYNTPFDEQCNHALGCTLAEIIRSMHHAKNNNISEDKMSEYSYEPKSFFKTNNHSYISLFFSLLKKYNLTTLQTPESLPFKKDTLYILPTIASDDRYKKVQDDYENNISLMKDTYAHQYPAFFTLINDLYAILYDQSDPVISTASYFYDPKIQEAKGSCSSSLALDEFYKQGMGILTADKSYDKIHKLLQMIEATRNPRSASYEQSLAQEMLTYNPSQLLNKAAKYLDSSHLNKNTKNHISNIFPCIQEYNKRKGFKSTPGVQQYLAFKLKEERALALPAQCNTSLFDCATYALLEFCCLIHHIDQVKKSYSLTEEDSI